MDDSNRSISRHLIISYECEDVPVELQLSAALSTPFHETNTSKWLLDIALIGMIHQVAGLTT
jgi:hypothetical protein